MSGHWPVYPDQPPTFWHTGDPTPPPALRWVVKECVRDSGMERELSDHGWEPFAVTTGPSSSPRIWWRKRVPV